MKNMSDKTLRIAARAWMVLGILIALAMLFLLLIPSPANAFTQETNIVFITILVVGILMAAVGGASLYALSKRTHRTIILLIVCTVALAGLPFAIGYPEVLTVGNGRFFFALYLGLFTDTPFLILIINIWRDKHAEHRAQKALQKTASSEHAAKNPALARRNLGRIRSLLMRWLTHFDYVMLPARPIRSLRLLAGLLITMGIIIFPTGMFLLLTPSKVFDSMEITAFSAGIALIGVGLFIPGVAAFVLQNKDTAIRRDIYLISCLAGIVLMLVGCVGLSFYDIEKGRTPQALGLLFALLPLFLMMLVVWRRTEEMGTNPEYFPYYEGTMAPREAAFIMIVSTTLLFTVAMPSTLVAEWFTGNTSNEAVEPIQQPNIPSEFDFSVPDMSWAFEKMEEIDEQNE